MFIGMLGKEQQEALASILQYVAKLDGENDAREDLLIKALLAESGLASVPEVAADQDAVEALLGRFDTDLAKRALLLESLGVALADDVLHENEIKAILAMADALNVDRAWVDRARDYVQRMLDLQREGVALVSGA